MNMVSEGVLRSSSFPSLKSAYLSTYHPIWGASIMQIDSLHISVCLSQVGHTGDEGVDSCPQSVVPLSAAPVVLKDG